ncbi:glycosyltransferase family 2 protein [Hymenobacter sp. GOD-10R]|uniref:glycosyltransferase family 2 protein n=1 Tax=Hymenobacter sp. GOD-10R TaxID=3093922 RepID=UPI002D7877D4|nr:glycosyltransferase [Hymenobacter sp. GOD-10R]WRQ27455.1 glycosyltransferase [Hymenobacter sp. GOD-10R]
MIPTYNCANYLRETLQSVLAQDPGEDLMQIEVIDDYSTKDDPEAVVAEIGRGRVKFFRQSQNVGHTRNFETCLQRSTGQIVHQLHGDDRVLPGFYEGMGSLLANYPEAGAAFCRYAYINENGVQDSVAVPERSTAGILDNWLLTIGGHQRIQTPSIVVRRAVYENLGGFDRRLSWTEDWEMWVRIAASYPVAYEPTVLAEYRRHQSSNTGQYIRSGENMRDVKRAIAIINEYMPVDYKNTQLREAFGTYAKLGLITAYDLLHRFQDKQGSRNQLNEAFSMNKNPYFLLRCLKLYLALL